MLTEISEQTIKGCSTSAQSRSWTLYKLFGTSACSNSSIVSVTDLDSIWVNQMPHLEIQGKWNVQWIHTFTIKDSCWTLKCRHCEKRVCGRCGIWKDRCGHMGEEERTLGSPIGTQVGSATAAPRLWSGRTVGKTYNQRAGPTELYIG